MKKTAFVVVALLLSACGNNQNASTENAQNTNTQSGTQVIRVATEGAYPPFNDIDTLGNPIGFDVEVMNALCAKLAANCQITTQDWDGILPALLSGKYDAVIAGMSITNERLAQVDFSEPYFANTMVWLAKKDGGFDPNNITNKNLCGQNATTGLSYIKEHYDGKGSNNVLSYDSYIKAYSDLALGRCDAVMAEKVSAKEWLKNNEGFGLIGDEIDNQDNIAIALAKGSTLKADFDEALRQIKQSGELAQIEAKYFN